MRGHFYHRLLIAAVAMMCMGGLCSCRKQSEESIGTETVMTEISVPETTLPQTTEAVTEAPEDPHEGMVKSYLTGEWVSKKIGEKRPLAVMINNVKGALPCNGLNSAGVIYETPMEGGEVRLEMILEDYKNLERIGSVRSARTYHPWIASEYDAIYIHFGRSKYAVSELNEECCDDIDGVTGLGYSAFYRTSDRKAPHNAFTTPELLDEKIKSLEFRRKYKEDYTGKFKFSENEETAAPAGGEAAGKVTIGYPINKPWFEYSEEDQLYYRYEFGEAQIDELDGKQVTCRNIIVQYCDYNMQPDNYTTDIHSVGSGTGVYITAGKAVPITWSKKDKWSNTIYKDENGQEIILNTGRTWVCIVLDDMTGEIEIEP
ncbi:MAG: DUF3048 domain-containing protein [Clostridiales bacterium]|nr:DUF3048 domain-containing protein [Clostridiales bacterium]